MSKNNSLRNSPLIEQIRNYLLANPISFTSDNIREDRSALYAKAAKKFDVSNDQVRDVYRKLRGKGLVENENVKKNNKKDVVDIDEPDDKETFVFSTEVIAEKVREMLKKKNTYSLEELSDTFDVGVGKIKFAIEGLIEKGHTIQMENGYVSFSKIIPKADVRILDVQKMSTGFYKFGAIGDNHMCSKYERNDVLNAMYDLYEKEGVKVVYNTGNWIDGEARFNVHDLLIHGLNNQIDYFLKNYPRREGITTYFITGDDHEGWYTQREGIDVGKYTQFKAQEAGRDDLVYLGHMEADVILKAPGGRTVIRVLHPGGGSSYAISYAIQKIVESYQGGEKPDILLAGHYHKADYAYVRGVHCVQTGTTQDQSPFMRKKKLAAHLGGWIIEVSTDDIGAVTRFKQEFVPFYDNGYYEKWEYKWK